MEKYIKLLQEFVSNHISAAEFEQAFIQLFTNDNNLLPSREFQRLDKLFADVDAYCGDPNLIEDTRFDIGEAELRLSAEETLKTLVKLITV